jgi:hypothetical protein
MPEAAAPGSARRRLFGAAAVAFAATPLLAWHRLALAQAAAEPAGPAATAPDEVRAALPAARLLGQARMRFLGFSVYDARLWVTPGFDAVRYEQQAFALELRYARALNGAQIAERSLQEMRRQGPLAEPQAERWLAFMREAFPDVAEGDRLTGLHEPAVGARFVFNGQRASALRDADFSRRFFGIWLAPQTSEPALRSRLLGGPTG